MGIDPGSVRQPHSTGTQRPPSPDGTYQSRTIAIALVLILLVGGGITLALTFTGDEEQSSEELEGPKRSNRPVTLSQPYGSPLGPDTLELGVAYTVRTLPRNETTGGPTIWARSSAFEEPLEMNWDYIAENDDCPTTTPDAVPEIGTVCRIAGYVQLKDRLVTYTQHVQVYVSVDWSGAVYRDRSVDIDHLFEDAPF